MGGDVLRMRVGEPSDLLEVISVHLLRPHHEGGAVLLRELSAPRLELGRRKLPHVRHPLLETMARLAPVDGLSALVVAALVHDHALVEVEQLALAGLAAANGVLALLHLLHVVAVGDLRLALRRARAARHIRAKAKGPPTLTITRQQGKPLQK